MTTLRKTWELILDIFFPPLCLNCKKYLEDGEKDGLICNSCFKSIETYKTLFHPATRQGGPSPNITLASAASYENPALRELIHFFKYKHFLKAQKPLGEITIRYLTDLHLNLNNFVVVPIPLHKTKYRKRGFNQAELLAQIVSQHFHLQLKNALLKRVKETKAQIELKDYRARYENLKNSFALNEKLSLQIKNKSVLLVDDIYTSGATANEAAKTLKRAGAKEIIVLVAAKAN